MKTTLLACLLAVFAVGQTKAPEQKLEKPAITLEQIEKRLGELKAQQTQAIANLNAIGGAIQLCEEWRDQLKQAEQKEPAKKGN